MTAAFGSSGVVCWTIAMFFFSEAIAGHGGNGHGHLPCSELSLPGRAEEGSKLSSLSAPTLLPLDTWSQSEIIH